MAEPVSGTESLIGFFLLCGLFNPSLFTSAPNMLSLVRSITYDAKAGHLASNPIEEIALLRNETFVEEKQFHHRKTYVS